MTTTWLVRSLVTAGLSAALSLFPGAGQAAPVLIDFESLSDGAFASSLTVDTGAVDVTFSSPTGLTLVTGPFTRILLSGTIPGQLGGDAITVTFSTGFRAQEVTITNRFFDGSGFSIDGITASAFDGSNNLIDLDSNQLTLSNPLLTSETAGFQIARLVYDDLTGPDPISGGFSLDNFTFDGQFIDGTVPAPASLSLLAVALAVFGAPLFRRRQATRRP